MTINANSKVKIGQSFANKYGQRFTVTGFSNDFDSWEARVEFYEVEPKDKWGRKYSELLEQFENKIREGKLTYAS